MKTPKIIGKAKERIGKAKDRVNDALDDLAGVFGPAAQPIPIPVPIEERPRYLPGSGPSSGF